MADIRIEDANQITRLAGNNLDSGGGSPGAVIVKRYDVTFDTAGISSGGATLFTPALDDVLLDVQVIVLTVWDGTTPLLDVGILQDGHFGTFGSAWNPLAANQHASGSENSVQGGTANITATNPPTDLVQALAWSAAQSSPASGSAPIVPGYFVSSAPFKVWVTQDGKDNGADPGSSQGAARIYVVTATP